MAGVISQRNQALVERLLDDLSKLMWTMVWDVANPDRWMLDAEEVYAELCLELVKLVNRYHAKPYIDLKRLCVVSLRNRVHDLATACYLTNRKAEAHMYSLDSGTEDDQTSRGDSNLDTYQAFPTGTYGEGYASSVDNIFDIDDFTDGMSEDAKALIAAVLNPSERVCYFLNLTACRKQTVNKKGMWTLTITPLIMARAMGWTSNRLKTAWAEVSDRMNDGAHFDGGLVAQEDESE